MAAYEGSSEQVSQRESDSPLRRASYRNVISCPPPFYTTSPTQQEPKNLTGRFLDGLENLEPNPKPEQIHFLLNAKPWVQQDSRAWDRTYQQALLRILFATKQAASDDPLRETKFEMRINLGENGTSHVGYRLAIKRNMDSVPSHSQSSWLVLLEQVFCGNRADELRINLSPAPVVMKCTAISHKARFDVARGTTVGGYRFEAETPFLDIRNGVVVPQLHSLLSSRRPELAGHLKTNGRRQRCSPAETQKLYGAIAEKIHDALQGAASCIPKEAAARLPQAQQSNRYPGPQWEG